MEEITVITKQHGAFFTAAAFIGGCYAGMATCTDKQLAERQARAYAAVLAAAGPLQPLDNARLGARAAVPRFALVVRPGGRWPEAVRSAAQLAALDVPMLATDEPETVAA
jgi:hypothetical protein